MMRSAISPRLAISIFLNGAEGKQGFSILDGLAVRYEPAFDDSRNLSFNLVHELHRFDDAEDLAGGDLFADADEWSGPGGGTFIERADNGGFYKMN